MSTNLPLRALRPLYRRNSPHYTVARAFSSTGADLRSRNLMFDAVTVKAHNSNNQQLAPGTSRTESLLDKEKELDDLGLFAGTFIRGNPPKLLPENAILSPRAWYDGFKIRGLYEWKWAKQRVFDVVGRTVYYWRLTNWPFRKRPIFWASTARNAASDNYERMYKAFAVGDEKEIQEICTVGLSGHFEKRLQARPSDTKMTWELVARDRRPRILSHRATKLPPTAGQPDSRATPTGLRQVVMRLKTKQRLAIEFEDKDAYRKSIESTRAVTAPVWSPDDAPFKGIKTEGPLEGLESVQVHEKETVEYIVLQQRMLRGELEPWRIWGFVEPSTLDSLAKDKAFEEESQAYQAAHPELTS